MTLADAFRMQKKSFISRTKNKNEPKITGLQSKSILKQRIRSRTIQRSKKSLLVNRSQRRSSAKGPRIELIERLASGNRVVIPKESIQKLTQKYYLKLPQVINKKAT